MSKKEKRKKKRESLAAFRPLKYASTPDFEADKIPPHLVLLPLSLDSKEEADDSDVCMNGLFLIIKISVSSLFYVSFIIVLNVFHLCFCMAVYR